MKLLMFALLFMGTTSSASGCGFDLFGTCKIAETLDKLPEKVRAAAQQVLDHLFNDLLPKTIDKLTAAAKQLEDRAEQDYEVAINATRVQLEELAEKIVHLAEQYAKDVTKDVEQIVDLVEKDTLALAQKVISDVDDRVNSLLTRLENDGKELFCAVEGYTDILQKEFSSYFGAQDCDCVQAMLKSNPGLAQDCDCTSCFHVGGFYPKCRCNPWGLQFGPGWYNQGKYDFLKCHLQKVIDWEKWTVDQIVKQLSIIQEAALSFRCLEDMNPGSTGNREYFTNEYTSVSHDILVMTRSPNSVRLSTLAAVPGAPGHAPSVNADPNACQGKTMQECLIQLMAQVKDAQKDLQTAKTAFDSAVSKESTELKIFTSECPDGWTEAKTTKGYVLVGRPDGATAGTQLNRPLSANETGRVGPHGHAVTDNGHAHGVNDPGHTHHSGLHGGVSGGASAEHDNAGPNNYDITTSKEGTGISVSNSKSGVEIPSGNAIGLDSTDHYPLLYVLVCQKVQSLTLVV